MQTYYNNIITYVLGNKNRREKRAQNPKTNYMLHFYSRIKVAARSANPMAFVCYKTYKRCKIKLLKQARARNGQDIWQIGKQQMINLLLETKNPRCPMCHQAFTEKNPYTVDHIVRLADGGNSHYNNLQLLHRHCHNKKEAKYDRQKNNKINGAKKKKVKAETLGQDKLNAIKWAKLKELNS